MHFDHFTADFLRFLAERPAISPRRLAQELGFNPANLDKIQRGARNIPQPRRGDFLRLMEKYGCTPGNPFETRMDF